jgi:uncharacterized caspase-like protein
MSAFEHGYAVVVGVAGYRAQGLPPLPLAVLNDAVDVTRTLWDPDICGYRADRVHLLLEEQATVQAVRQELEWLVNRCTEEDTAVIFFSGHGWTGDRKSYLACYDAWPGPPCRGMIEGEELAGYLSAIPAGRLVVLLDSCFSGGISEIRDSRASASGGYPGGLDEGTYEKLCAGRGRVLLASSGSSEKSVALPRERNSLFTSCVLRGLRGEADSHELGAVGIFDLFRFVSKEVQEKSNGFQNPLLKARMMDDFPMALRSGRRSDPVTRPAPPTAPATAEADGRRVQASLYIESSGTIGQVNQGDK